ncbi:MAG TPA: class I SAM-dependent methyltransferase [Bacteroidota bacterium]|nr:class I SAM-dependent methyltransferase [Bacteroidota bacterium]
MEEPFKYQGKSVLEVMSDCAVNRNNAVEELIVRYFGLNDLRAQAAVLEFGAGSGEFIDRFAGHPNIRTLAVELDDGYLQHLRSKHAAYRTLSELPAPVDYIFTIDVLEHIEHDDEILKELFSSLQSGGRLLVYVPARPELYSKFDASIGHYRRYRLNDLRGKVRSAGFDILVSKYDDFLGYFAAVYNKFTSDGSLNERAVRLYDRLFVPVSRSIESLITPPIGKNIILVAEKPGR